MRYVLLALALISATVAANDELAADRERVLEVLSSQLFSKEVAAEPAEHHQRALRDRFSDAELVAIAREAGVAQVDLRQDGVVLLDLRNSTVVLFNHGDGDLRLYFALAGMATDLAALNAWNRDTRLSRAYLDEDGDPVLEADLLANGGMTEDKVIAFIQIFGQSLNTFRRHLLSSSRGS